MPKENTYNCIVYINVYTKFPMYIIIISLNFMFSKCLKKINFHLQNYSTACNCFYICSIDFKKKENTQPHQKSFELPLLNRFEEETIMKSAYNNVNVTASNQIVL